jgi:signal transduction histidine kinase/HAMP domain-containing protein
MAMKMTTLRRKLIVTITTTLAVGLVLSTLLSTVLLSQLVERNAEADARSRVTAMVNAAQMQADRLLRETTVLAEDPQLVGLVSAGSALPLPQTHAQLIALLQPDFNDLGLDVMDVVNAQRRMIVRVQDSARYGDIPQSQSWLSLTAMLQGHKTLAIEQDDNGGSWMIRTGAPIALATTHTPIGALVLGQAIGDSFANTIEQLNGAPVAIYHQDKMIAHSQDMVMALPASFVAQLATGTSWAFQRTQLGGAPFLLAGYHIPSISNTLTNVRPDMVFVVAEPLTQFNQLINRVIALLVLAGIATALIVMCLVFWFATHISWPVRQLQVAAAAIAGGDLDYQIAVHSNDEVGQLAQSFGEMVGSLKEKIAESNAIGHRLLALLALSNALIATLDFQQIGRAVTKDVATIMRACRTSIVIADAASHHLVVVARWLSETEHARTAQHLLLHRQWQNRQLDPWQDMNTLDVKLAEAALQQHRIVAAEQLAAPPTTERDIAWGTAARQQGLGAAIALPLIVHDQIIGVLNVYLDAPHAFTEQDLFLLNTAANQAAIAVKNAQLFAEVRESNSALERANDLKSEFLANVSHELRTPLNAIIGFGHCLLEGLDGDLNEAQAKDLGIILSSAEDLLKLINDILDLSKIEAERLDLRLEEIDMQACIDTVVSQMMPLATAKGLKLFVESAPQLPHALADSARVRQVLLNLISNAIKFTEQGEVRIRSWATETMATVAVSDTGIGLAPAALEYIFEAFRQVDGSSTRQFSGTGLGLTIARNLVELQGGSMMVESEPGHGSTFSFTLPLAVVDISPPGWEEAETIRYRVSAAAKSKNRR